MSEQDSFINEVSEEVRRDKLYALFRRYGWIAAALIILVVGGAAFNEWRKARAQAEAEAAGEAMLAALNEESAEARSAALAGIPTPEEADRRAVLALMTAAAEVEAGQDAQARDRLDAIAGDTSIHQLYRDIAALKSAMLPGDGTAEDRIQRLQPLMQPGNPFRLLAIEQKALAEIEQGQTESALETLQGIIADADVTEGLRRRAGQLIVALGGELSEG